MTAQHICRGALALAAFATLSSVASAQPVNGLMVNPRVFNDFSTSTLTITNTNSIPGTVTIDDRNFTDDGIGGSFANRHDVLLSSDNGASARTFSPNVGFTISTNINLATNANSPRKEAGIRINDPVTGDTLFLINSDAGEIVSFGGGAAFNLFGNNAGGNGYTPGTTINIGLTYTPGSPTTTGATPATIEYFVDRDINSAAGFSTSGPLAYSNLEGGPLSFTVGLYTQGGGSSANDFITTTFSNIQASVVPEPTMFAAVGLAGLMLRRRRTAC